MTFDAGSYKFGDIELPRVDAIAARDAAGKLWVSLTNLDPTRREHRPDVAGASVTRAVGRILAAPKIDSVNTFEAPNTVAPKPLQQGSRARTAGQIAAGLHHRHRARVIGKQRVRRGNGA